MAPIDFMPKTFHQVINYNLQVKNAHNFYVIIFALLGVINVSLYKIWQQ
jgi:hypothetical protein